MFLACISSRLGHEKHVNSIRFMTFLLSLLNLSLSLTMYLRTIYLWKHNVLIYTPTLILTTLKKLAVNQNDLPKVPKPLNV